MKKLIGILLILALASMTGCAEKVPPVSEGDNATAPEVNVEDAMTDPAPTETLPVETTAGAEVDVDLTQLSSTMVYAEVYNMLYVPEDYMGKTIRIAGIYRESYYDETDTYYHFVVIPDAQACCEEGLEFILEGGEYPSDGDIITVEGTYGTYDEGGLSYYYISATELRF